MKQTMRVLMWVHYCYLLLLPTLAVVSAQMMFPETDLWMQILIFGFPAVLMYSLFLANGYAIPDSLPIALVVILTIPIQIAAGVYLFGGGSLWLFFAESASVEIGSFVLGVMTVALTNRSKDTGGGRFGCLLIFAFVLFFLGILPHIALVFFGYGGFSMWLIPFATAFAWGYWEYANIYRKLGAAYRRHGEAQELEMKFDGGILSRIFGLNSNAPLLSPNWPAVSGGKQNDRVFIFGVTAMFLPLVAGMLMSLILGGR